MLNQETKQVSGYIILTVPTIAYGGYFLLQVLAGAHTDLELTAFQQSMFRAGHAHAGVLVLLALVAQIFVQYTQLSTLWRWLVRVSFPVAAILVSGGFFAAAIGQHATEPNGFIAILYIGVAVLVFGLIGLGVGLVRKV